MSSLLPSRKFIGINESVAAIAKMAAELGVSEITLVANPSYIYRPFDIYPMAPKITTPRTRLTAIVKDMDGTTTTTEALCLHSLEFMIGKICNLDLHKNWGGLDHQKDYAHIIGNSTTKHIEYLIRTYSDRISLATFRRAYIYAAIWTLAAGKDPHRKEEVRAGLDAFGVGDLLKDVAVKSFTSSPTFDEADANRLVNAIAARNPKMPRLGAFEERVRAAIDIYYEHYHEILAAISEGKGDALSAEILRTPGAHLIEPMPAAGIFLATVKGWLGKDLANFDEELAESLRQNPRVDVKESELQKGTARLANLGDYFERNPLRVAIVTSSIEYEARIVLSKVFKILYRQAETWEITSARKQNILAHFSEFEETYDAFITASDSSEIRLKPHPDLYSMALHKMGIAPELFDTVIGFEDSESGTRAIRCAGVGLCIALPFPQTQGHNLSAASHILYGGLPEAILLHNLFLAPVVLTE